MATHNAGRDHDLVQLEPNLAAVQLEGRGNGSQKTDETLLLVTLSNQTEEVLGNVQGSRPHVSQHPRVVQELFQQMLSCGNVGKLLLHHMNELRKLRGCSTRGKLLLHKKTSTMWSRQTHKQVTREILDATRQKTT